MSRSPKSERRPRSVPTVYGLASLAILIAVATLALVVSPPGPPALAEFAPRAEDRIDEALKAQSSSFGTGDGGDCAAGQQCAEGGSGQGGLGVTTTTTGPKNEKDVDVARVRRCVGDPPRQTEDPQSPPCVNYFEGDNGGATSEGVTRDTITVAVPNYLDDPSFDDFVDHFNKRYELYGRKLRIVKVSFGSSRDENTEAAPVDAAAEAHAFAYSTFYLNNLNAEVVQRAAARHHMISVIPYSNQTTTDTYRELAPYAWSFPPAADELERDLGDFTCTSLNGKLAEFARGDLRVKSRRYAVLRSRSDHPLDMSGLNAALGRCGIDPPPVYDIKFNDDRDSVLRTYLTMKDAGTTTLLLTAHADDVTQWASKLPSDFEPEWVISGLAVPESEAQWHVVMPNAQRPGLFGVFPPNKFLPVADTPAWWAYRENHPEDSSDPTTDRHLYAQGATWNQAYRALLLLASGIQLAGPKLTPETFAQGLQRARFPNPGAGTAPYYQARVGFGPGDYTMSRGSAVVWWSDTAPAYSGGGTKGGWCYVRRGTRFERDWVDVSPELFDPNPGNCR